MEVATIGRVLVTAKIENIYDLYEVTKGTIPEDQARTVEVNDALVDTGSSGLLLPTAVIRQLGLQPVLTRTARTIAVERTVQMYQAVRLTIQGRSCTCDVGEIADCFPVIIGQIPLEAMDWVIDMKHHCLTGNPAHGGEFMIDA